MKYLIVIPIKSLSAILTLLLALMLDISYFIVYLVFKFRTLKKEEFILSRELVIELFNWIDQN